MSMEIMAKFGSEEDLLEKIFGERYYVSALLSRGTFSRVYLGVDTTTKEKVALKIEKINSKYQLLRSEATVLKILGGVGVPNFRWYHTHGDYNILVMDYLQHNLQEKFVKCLSRFSLKTVLMLADQMLTRIEYVHSKSFVHRDIKPDNFVMGGGRKSSEVFLIDFGLAKRYYDTRSHMHIPLKENKGMIGSLTFSSINTLMGVEKSRRDDLEGLGYVLIYFLKGYLPWEGLKAKTVEQKRSLVLTKKISTNIEELCRGLPVEFSHYIDYCRRLLFDEKPDYTYLKKLFREVFIREGMTFDYDYDWSTQSAKRGSNDSIPEEDMAHSIGIGRRLTRASIMIGNPMITRIGSIKGGPGSVTSTGSCHHLDEKEGRGLLLGSNINLSKKAIDTDQKLSSSKILSSLDIGGGDIPPVALFRELSGRRAKG